MVFCLLFKSKFVLSRKLLKRYNLDTDMVHIVQHLPMSRKSEGELGFYSFTCTGFSYINKNDDDGGPFTFI